MAPRLPSRATSIREPRLVPGRVRFESVPSQISAPQTHLDNVNLSTSTVIQLHALGITNIDRDPTACPGYNRNITPRQAMHVMDHENLVRRRHKKMPQP